MASPEIDDILHKFETLTQKPVNYLTVQTGVKQDIKNLVKSLYDYTKSEEINDKKLKKSALPELIIQDFDEEQIWQELELQNSECWDQILWDVANCMSSKKDLVFPVKTLQPKEDAVGDNMGSEDGDIDEDIASEGDIDEDFDENHETSESKGKDIRKSAKSKETERNIKPSIVDDKFFKLQEMEKFLLSEEKKDGKEIKKVTSDSDEESIDMFEESGGESEEEEGGKEMMYSDFFDRNENEQPDYDDDEGNEIDDVESESDHENDIEENQSKKPSKKDKKVTFADESSDDDTDDNSEVEANVSNGKPEKYEKKSEFELRQQRLQQQISRLEEKTLNEAPWQLKGEVDANKRPQNSLLQEVVDFDLTSRPPPVITEQTTVTLEQIIQQRVKDKAWDDVIRKEKPVDDQLSFRKTEILDQSKSKLSLAQVYEAEYLKQKQAMSGEVEEEKEPESHTEIKDAMNKLFSKLDALCHYHYTPKAPQADVKIVSNTPAISMEEVAPVAASDAALLAPEEVKKKRRGDLMSKEERTQTDKNRERRKKKKLQKSKGQVEKVTDNRNTKKAAEASDKSLKTSKAFFQQLNDDTTSLIKNKNNKRNVKNKGQ